MDVEILEQNNTGGKGLNNCMFSPREIYAGFQFGLKNPPIASGISAQPSCYKRTESNLLADEKGPQKGDPDNCMVIHL